MCWDVWNEIPKEFYLWCPWNGSFFSTEKDRCWAKFAIRCSNHLGSRVQVTHSEKNMQNVLLRDEIKFTF